MTYRRRVIRAHVSLTRLTRSATVLAVGAALSVAGAPSASSTTMSAGGPASRPVIAADAAGVTPPVSSSRAVTAAAVGGVPSAATDSTTQPTGAKLALKDAPATAPQQAGASLLPTPKDSNTPTLAGVGGRLADPRGAQLLGLTWAGAAPDRMELRSRDRSGTWSPWAVLDDAGRTAQAPTGKGSTEAIWVGDATSVEVRAVRAGVDVTPELTLNLVTSPRSASDAAYATITPSAAAALVAATSPVRMYSRAEWGADETWRAQDAPTYSDELRAAVVHHTASTNTYAPEDVPAQIRSFYYYHTKVQGWRDIGYNALVDKWGRLWEGRYGGADLNLMGAQALGFNWQTVGISMIGTHASLAPTAAELETVAQWIAWRFRLAAITTATGTTQLTSRDNGTRWPSGTVVTVTRIIGHRDVNLTDCPGNAGWAALPAVRARVAALLAALPPGPGVGKTLTATSPRRTSDNGAYAVAMRTDGVLAVTDSAGATVWSSLSTGPGGRLTIDPTGRMLLVNAAGAALWSSGTISPGAFLRLLDDGNLVLSAANGQPIWDSGNLTASVGVNVPALPRITNLAPGDSIGSLDGSHLLAMQADGNLVLYRVSPWAPAWWSNTFVPGSHFLKTDTGAMAVLAPNGDPVWVVPATLPNGLFTIQDDGNLTLSSVANGVVWDSKGFIDNWAMTYKGLATIWTMPPNTLRTSPNGQYRLHMQGDGNLVVYTQDDKVVWASMTFGTGIRLQTQWTDGNVVLYRADNTPVWASMSAASGSWLQLQDDGNLVLYAPGPRAVWDAKGYLGKTGVHLG